VNKIIQGNALSELKKMTADSIDCCITSPPYFGLRSYETIPQIWDANPGCGHEWIEDIQKPKGGKGSKYANVGANKNDEANLRDGDTITNFCYKCPAWKCELGLEPTFQLYIKHLLQIFDEVKRVLKKTGTCFVNLGDSYGGSIMPKSLIGIPERFAIAMTDSGWIRRNTIIWYKRNCMPSSVTDRFTIDFEYIYFFTKSKKYWFEQQFQSYSQSFLDTLEYKRKSKKAGIAGGMTVENQFKAFQEAKNGKGRNMRCVWDIPTQAFHGSHFAVFPTTLVVPMIKSGCPPEGIVLDPFSGAGTTCLVAKKLDRQYIGIEINSKYIEMAEQRIEQECGMLI